MSGTKHQALAEQLARAREEFVRHGWVGAHARLWSAGLDVSGGVPLPVAFCFEQGKSAVALLQPPHLQALGFAGATVARCLLARPPANIWAAGMRSVERSAEEELEAAMLAALAGHDAVAIDRFGLFVASSSWRAIVERVAALEHAARVTALARQSAATPASGERVARLVAGLNLLGIEADSRCDRCNACPHGGLQAGGRDALAEALASAIDAHLDA